MNDQRVSLVCLDVSIFLKVLLNEEDSELADKLLRQIIASDLHIIEPRFFLIELFSVLRHKVFFKKLSLKDASSYIRLVELLKINYFDEDLPLVKGAYSISSRLNIAHIYDSIYLSLAKKHKAKFITCDIKFYKKALKLYKKSYTLSSFSIK